MLKICVVSQQLKKSISGVGLHTNNLVHHLSRDGNEVWVVVPEDQIPEGSLPYHVWRVNPPLLGDNQARWISLSWNFSRALTELTKREHFDLIHFTDVRESLLYFGKIPTVGNINDTYSAELHSLAYYRRHFQDWLIRWLYYHVVHSFEGIAVRKLDTVIANSLFTTGIVILNYRVKPQKLITCYKSIDPEKYRLSRELRAIQPPHPPVVLFVGTNMQRKGLPVLIQSASNILATCKNTQFWVVGEDKAVPRMKDLCKEAGVLDSFRFMGWQSQTELTNTYAQADIFVMPSITEALGMVFVEAMASGVAVVGTEVGGIPEIIDHEVNGLLVAPNNPDQLAEAIVRLIQDEPFRSRLVEKSKTTVDQFSVSRMMKSTYEIYASTLQQKKR